MGRHGKSVRVQDDSFKEVNKPDLFQTITGGIDRLTFDEKRVDLDKFLYDPGYLDLGFRLSERQYNFVKAATISEPEKRPHTEFVIVVGKGCVAGDTIVDGTGMTIADLEEKKIAPKVISFNPDTGKTEESQCENPPFIEGYKYHMYEVELEDGKKITVTPEHEFYGKEGKVLLSDLQIGDEVLVVE